MSGMNTAVFLGEIISLIFILYATAKVWWGFEVVDEAIIRILSYIVGIDDNIAKRESGRLANSDDDAAGKQAISSIDSDIVPPSSTSSDFCYPLFENGCPGSLPSSTMQTHNVNVHGVEVTHYYPWMEAHCQSISSWLHAQAKCTEHVLSQESFAHTSNIFRRLLLKAGSYKEVGPPLQQGEYYFYLKSEKGKHYGQPSLYYTKDIRKEGILLIDARGLLSSASPFVLRGTWVSTDGFKVAYGISEKQANACMTIFVRDVLSALDSEVDVIYGCRADASSISWLEGHVGFFYSRYSKNSSAVYYHRLKTEQSEDLLVFESSDCQSCIPVVSFDCNYLLIEVYPKDYVLPVRSHRGIEDDSGNTTLGHSVIYRDVSLFDGRQASTLGPLVVLIESSNFRFEYLTNLSNKFLFRTNFKAPRFQVVQLTALPLDPAWFSDSKTTIGTTNNKRASQTDTGTTLAESWDSNIITIIPENQEGSIVVQAFVAAQNSTLIVQTICKACHELLVYDIWQHHHHHHPQAPLQPIASLPHPNCGAFNQVHFNYHSSNIFFQVSGMADPGSVYRAVIRKHATLGQIDLTFDQLYRSRIPDVDLSSFTTLQEYYPSHIDGTKIPMFLLSKATALTNRSRPRPCILYASGAFGASGMPTFSLPLLLFVHNYDGIVCVANVRGGGELGQSWHINGSGVSKHKSVADMVSAVDYLLKRGLTDSGQLSLMGGGMGAILAASCLVHRPTSIAAIVFEDGIFDLMRHCHLNPPEISSKVSITRGYGILSQGVNATADAMSQGSEAQLVTTVTSTWIEEIGNPESSASECQRILALSPLHNLKNAFETVALAQQRSDPLAKMPAVLAMTSTKSIVSAIHSYKLIAELQRLSLENGSKSPCILHSESSESHSLLESMDDRFTAKHATILGFILRGMNLLPDDE